MTNENVILILEQIRDHYDGTCKEALDIAISALREKGTDTERIKQILSELAQYNADMLKAFEMGKTLAKREKGEWRVSHTDVDEVWAICSNCDGEIEMKLDDDCTPIFYNFCPNCGAYMRGE